MQVDSPSSSSMSSDTAPSMGLSDDEWLAKLNTLADEHRTVCATTRNVQSTEARAVRQQLQTTCLHLIHERPKIALDNEVALLLWRTCVHKPAEDLRAKLSRGSLFAKAPAKFLQVRDYYKGFLVGAKTRIYKPLLTYSLKKAGLILDGNSFKEHDYEEKATSQVQLYCALLTSHRCLMYLGDLERYYALLPKRDGQRPSKVNFLHATRYYKQALALLPGFGWPCSQLAIAATYTKDSNHSTALVGAHLYFQAIAVKDRPFKPAQDNLAKLFLVNRDTVKNKTFLCVDFQSDFPSRLVALYDLLMQPAAESVGFQERIANLSQATSHNLYNRTFGQLPVDQRGGLLDFAVNLVCGAIFVCVQSSFRSEALAWVEALGIIFLKAISPKSLSLMVPVSLLCDWLFTTNTDIGTEFYHELGQTITRIAPLFIAQLPIVNHVLMNKKIPLREERSVYGYRFFAHAFPVLEANDLFNKFSPSSSSKSSEMKGKSLGDEIAGIVTLLKLEEIPEKKVEISIGKLGSIRRFLKLLAFSLGKLTIKFENNVLEVLVETRKRMKHAHVQLPNTDEITQEMFRIEADEYVLMETQPGFYADLRVHPDEEEEDFTRYGFDAY